MKLDLSPDWILAGCAVLTLFILWTTTAAGAVWWISRSLAALKTEILAELNTKHEVNQSRYDALAVLVTRHDTILDPEFSSGNGVFKHGRHS